MKTGVVILPLLCLMAMTSPVFAGGAHPAAQTVLDKLLGVTGKDAVPPLKIEITKSASYIARYLATSKIIQVEQKTLRICSSFGADSLTALAFIIGHELAHARQDKVRQSGGQTSYLAWDRNTPTDRQTEREADVQGVFCAYLAGYKKYYELLPRLMDKIYQEYGLTDEELTKYPSRQERQQTAKTVIAEVERLVQVYETAACLSAAGQYELAARSLDYVLKFFQGREVYNNAAVNYALWALNAPDENALPYLYPLEVDWNTRLKKPLVPGAKETEDWNALIARAAGYLNKARTLDPDYLPAIINLLVVKSLGGQKQALETLKATDRKALEKKAVNSSENDRLSLAFGVLYACAGYHDEAAKTWESLIRRSASQQVKNQASFNLKMLKGESCQPPAAAGCAEPLPSSQTVDGVRLHRPPFAGQTDEVEIYPKEQIRLYISGTEKSTIFHFEKKGRNMFCLQRIPASVPAANLESRETLLTAEGFFMVCGNALFLIDEKENRVKEWAKFHAFFDD